MTTTHLLIVDSDRERAKSLKERARSDVWDVALAVTAQEARETLGMSPITLLLVDSSVWRDAGLREYIASSHPLLPVIVLTGGDEGAEGLIQQLQLGAMTYVPRDADRRRLIETIETIINVTRRNPYRERIREFLRAGEVELHIGNDPKVIPVVVGYVQRVLEDYGLSNENEMSRIGVALTEALANAVIHGNLEVGSESRGDDTDAYYRAIDERLEKEPYRSRDVHVIMRFSQSSATFVIRDQGRGFDRGAVADPTAPENLTRACGRGILLMKAYCDVVTWNNDGTEVTLVKSLKP